MSGCGSAMTASKNGFTLIEVMAAVLVLGLLYTVLATAAMRGLRSEGTDRRRADAAMIADRRLAEIETKLSAGKALKDGRTQDEQEPFKILVEVAPADLLGLLPARLRAEIARSTDPKAPSVLHDERGQSRVRRVSVVVAWDEAGEPDQVERTTFAFDTSTLAQYFPPAGDAAKGAANHDPLDELRKQAPPELQSLIPGGNTAPGPTQ
jgi:prepilin-type N-terminal cleavage/methylation domain-containing protein